MSFVYANPTSGPSAGAIGWFDFGNITLSPGQTLTGLTGTLPDGSTVTFDATNVNVSGTPQSLAGSTLPTWSLASFGNAAMPLPNYGGIAGFAGIRNIPVPGASVEALSISNLVVKDPNGNPIANYEVVVADAESTNTVPGETAPEGLTFVTNGGVWNQLAICGPVGTVAVSGAGTQTFNISGLSNNNPVAAYVMTTHSPTALTLSMTRVSNSQQGFSIGFVVTKITVEKHVGQRIDPADQFVLDIGGTPNAQATTTGAADGIQTEKAVIYALPGNTYTINESLAPGSGSTLSQYTVVTSAANATPAGSVPPTGALPVSFTPALGDDVTYTILNAAPETFSKTVDKAYADVGEVLTYTIKVDNPNTLPLSNVLVTDATPAGTTYLGNLVVSVPFTGTNPPSGLTLTTIGPNSSATISYQVQVNSTPPIPTPIPNVATVAIPGKPVASTNVVETQVAHAFVAAQKSVDKAFANVGDILTYTIALTNAGNVAANNVVLTDAIPAGTTFVAGSVTGATGTPPTLTLTAPIPAGGSTTITYKVKVGATVPAVNPVKNIANVAYTYTVDPAKPNGAISTTISNTVITQVSNATLVTHKATDKTISYVGDVITYSVSVKNTGNVPASNVILTDPVPVGTTYVPGSLITSVPATGSPLTTIALTNPIAPGETVTLTYKVTVTAIPNPNPVANTMTAAFTYTVNPNDPNGVKGTSASNTVNTVVFKNNYSQQISDLINSIALEEAAIGNIANAEGAKIQKMLALGATPEQLLCVNKSVSDMMDALNTLESVLKQKLNAVNCQISPTCMP